MQKKEKKPTKKQIQSFQNYILWWYQKNKRNLPRRDSQNPYYVFVSEIMLQQTQVPRVIPKFLEFIREIPTIQDLATSNQEKLLKLRLWLGFNRRVLAMKKTAEIICNKYNWNIPDDPNILKNLPGIWKYTATSIPVFAYNKEIPVIDINIKRVIQTRIMYDFGTKRFINFVKKNTRQKQQKIDKITQQYLLEICTMLIPKRKSCIRHNALMDYWSIVLTSSKTWISSPKQKPFAWSTRQVRWAILKKILANWPQDINVLKKSFQHKDFDIIIQSLCDENFTTITNWKLKIKK